MTLIETRDEPVDSGRPARVSRTRLRTRVLAVGVALVLVAGGIAFGVFWHASASYAPLHDAGLFGPRPDAPAARADHVEWIDGTNDLALRGPAGTHQEFEFVLRNDGAHPVTVTGIDRPGWLDGQPDPISPVVWAPYRDAGNGGSINGLPTASRQFPAHLGAGDMIKIRFTVTKPACPHLDPHAHAGFSPTLRVHWNAMISSHVTTIEFGGPDYDIDLC